MALLCAVAWASGLWAALGVVAVAGTDTAGRLTTLPPIWLLLLLASFAMAVVRALRLTASDAAPLALAMIAWLPWIPGRLPPAFFLFAGPLSWVVAFAA